MKEKTKSGPDTATDIETSSHIPANPLYTPADLKGSDPQKRSWISRRISLHSRRAGHHVPRPPLDHAPVRRHGRRRGIEQALQILAGEWHHGTFRSEEHTSELQSLR